jgi:hypothetical protein
MTYKDPITCVGPLTPGSGRGIPEAVLKPTHLTEGLPFPGNASYQAGLRRHATSTRPCKAPAALMDKIEQWRGDLHALLDMRGR